MTAVPPATITDAGCVDRMLVCLIVLLGVAADHARHAGDLATARALVVAAMRVAAFRRARYEEDEEDAA